MPLIKLRSSAKKAGLKPGSKRYLSYIYGTEHKIKVRRKLKRKRGRK